MIKALLIVGLQPIATGGGGEVEARGVRGGEGEGEG